MKPRRLLAVFLFSAVHLALTAYCLVQSLYLTFPGEAGFDPGAAQRAALFGEALKILAFPLVTIAAALPPSAVTGGLAGWIWFAWNSLLWGAVVVWVWPSVAKRASRGPAARPENSG